VTNRELSNSVNFALGVFADKLIAMQGQQEELAARIAFIAPTPSEIDREVDHFIASATSGV